MKYILQSLFDHKKLTKEEAKEILVNISQNIYNEAQIAAFITVYLMRTISADELAGFREALLELCIPVDFPDYQTIDVCGTGGDGKNTFNISTLSAFVIAGAGYKVTKHGNTGVSSVSGSSDVLQFLGYQFTNNQDKLRNQLEKANICYLHAPLFHPALKSVGPIRKQMGIKTFFNVLGPLVNPCKPKYQMVGVYNLELQRIYQYILQQTDTKYAIIHALDGYDEISLTGEVKIKQNEKEKILTAQSFGFENIKSEQVFGGLDIKDAAHIFMNLLNDEATLAQKQVVIANAAIGIQLFNPNSPLSDCVQAAKESIESKKALNSFKSLIVS
jgi:anthranilate phosphoribosyltransferase